MNPTTLGIVTAKIHFYETPFHHLSPDRWVWSIKFEECPVFTPDNRIHFAVGFTAEEAEKNTAALKKYLARNFIFDESTVAVIYMNEQVVAIGRRDSNYWLDVRDMKVKCFASLKLSFNDLVVKF